MNWEPSARGGSSPGTGTGLELRLRFIAIRIGGVVRTIGTGAGAVRRLLASNPQYSAIGFELRTSQTLTHPD